MPRSIHVPDPHHFTVGTVGPPGQRTFFLQAADDGALVSFKLEKQQVAALAEYLQSVLADLPELSEPVTASPELVEPVVAEWAVGGIGIAVDPGADRILLIIHELMPEPSDDAADQADDDEVAELLAELAGLDVDDLAGDTAGDDDEGDEDVDEDEFDEELAFRDEDDGSMARLRLTRQQVAAFILRASELLEAGRPLCPFCGLPLDPDGHFCPRAN